MRCIACRLVEEDARLDGAPLCLPCVERVLAGARLVERRACSRCRAPVDGGRDDPVPVCVACATAELERAMAVELAAGAKIRGRRRDGREEVYGLEELLPPLRERWRPRPLPPVTLSEDQTREQLAVLRRVFREEGRIVPPPPPRRHWLDD